MSAFERLHAYVCQPHVIKIVIAVSLVLLAIVTVLVVRRILTTPLATKMVFNDVVSGAGNKVVIKAGAIPELRNGSEFGYSFWLYLNPSGPTNNDRLVFAHPADGKGIKVVLSPDSNMLQFKADESSDAPAIKYVPMSRWVHIVAVYANGTLTYFMDGEVHSVHAVGGSNGAEMMGFSGPSANMTVSGGHSVSVPGGTAYDSFQGYVGYISFMNFYPSPGLVKRMYAKGPFPEQGFFNMFGMMGYGVRSPVYKISNSAPTATNNVRL